MNHSCEMWSRPWHALQKNLAEGISGHLFESYASLLRASNMPGAVRAVRIAEAQGMVKVRGFTVSANSWLSRIQLQTPVATARQ